MRNIRMFLQKSFHKWKHIILIQLGLMNFIIPSLSFVFQGRTADFPPSKLKSGYGEHVCYVLDCLAEEALKYIGFTWKR